MLQGIRILDKENGVVNVKLNDIINSIPNFKKFHWSILISDVIPNPGLENNIINIEKKLEGSKKGLELSWDELKTFSDSIYQEIDLTLVGFKNERKNIIIDNYKEIYQLCDVIIEMIDSSFWEIRSKDLSIIKSLKDKFKNTYSIE